MRWKEQLLLLVAARESPGSHSLGMELSMLSFPPGSAGLWGWSCGAAARPGWGVLAWDVGSQSHVGILGHTPGWKCWRLSL